MKITLPLPPSTNHLYANVPGVGRVKTMRYKQWIKAADKYYLAQLRNIKPVSGPISLAIRLPANTRGDTSNRIKAAEDYLVKRQITGDDKHTWKVSAERVASVAEGECEIEITTGIT